MSHRSNRSRAYGPGRGRGNGRDQTRGMGREIVDQLVCRSFQNSACRFGDRCKFSHDVGRKDGGKKLPKLQETPDQQQVRADYHAWKTLIKMTPFRNIEPVAERLWNGALTILNGYEREWKQMLPRDLEDEENYSGREHIKALLEMRPKTGAYHTYVQLVRSFLLVITHSAFLDCLSVDTFVGALYTFIGGANGVRAIPFFQHVCEALVNTYVDKRHPATSAILDTTLAATSTALRELLRREPRVRFNEELPTLIESMGNTVQIISGGADSRPRTATLNHLAEVKAIVARANGLLYHEQDQQNMVDLTLLTSTYPRGFSMPGDRHDNDKRDITKMKIFPTREEIVSDDVVFLPSTDPDQPHFLADSAERHIDTQFRLLRYDTFGELRDVLGTLMHAVETDPASPNLDLGGFRANHYKDAHISYVEFENRRGLQIHITFTQPFNVRKKTDAERCKWWEESNRLKEGTLLSFISFHEDKAQQLFLIVTEKCTSPEKNNSVVSNSKRATITAKLATYDQANVECAVRLSCGKGRGMLLDFPGILPATFVPILENLQDMQRLSRLPFRQWVVPDRINDVQQSAKVDIPPPLYARDPGFKFSLEPLLKSGEAHENATEIDPFSASDEAKTIDEMEARTSLDRGQCRALLAALTREFTLIQGPPGTGKTYLGLQLMRVLMHHKKLADLGPVVVVCYTNHALDQFLEHLLSVGIKKVVRIGGSSKSILLKDHNLRKVSQSETKSKSENYLLAKLFQSLENEAELIKRDLGKAHGLLKEAKWSNLNHHLRQNFPRVHEQFLRIDKEGFEAVGRHPFDLWVSGDASIPGAVHNDEYSLMANDLRNIVVRAELNVMSLSPTERHALARSWADDVHSQTLDILFERLKQAENIQQQIRKIYDEIDRRALQGADVVGLTTTGLAKRIPVLKHVRCKVVICEEAGEVMEPHILSALLPTIEHFIQIGDHEQLRPQINDFVNLSLESKQGALYQLDRSQFERLSVGLSGRPKLPIAQLNVQRRMRPEISTLVRETIYPDLVDHPTTGYLSNVVGMRKNIFWLDHDQWEEDPHAEMHQQKSHSNVWEVQMVHSLVRHLVRQGVYRTSDIAVLTPYTGQLQQLRSAMRNDFEIVLNDRDHDALEKDGFAIGASDSELMDAQPQYGQTKKKPLEKKKLSDLLRVATVDNFQGEEAKVIIVSLVRSNQARKVGFLRSTNRINVLLSRAQHGMYLIGNADTYSNVPMWQKVIKMLRTSNSIDTTLELCCPRHTEDPIEISSPNDFVKLSPEGGCHLACPWRLPDCGHMCQSRCHSKSMHDVFLCPQKCQRLHDSCGHSCQKQTCGEECGQCFVKVKDVKLPCGHLKDEVLCYLAQQPSAINCNTQVYKKVSECNHIVQVPCSADTTSDRFRCSTPCGAILVCGHTCPGTCASCAGTSDTPESHQECQKICGRPRASCSHVCRQRCHVGKDCGPCVSPCEVQCQHSRCMLLCHQPCAPCVEACTWSCEHQGICSMPCSAPCDRLPCSERCSENLPCGHRCPGLCGEICPQEHCHQCGLKQDARVDLLEMKNYAEIDVNETPIVLLGCGHFFTTETLDGMIGLQAAYITNQNGLFTDLADVSGTLAPKIPQCPDCQRPVRQYVTQRYNRIINRAVIDEMSKRFLVDGQRDLRELEDLVHNLEGTLEKSRSEISQTSNVANHRQNRHTSSASLTKRTKNFLHKVANRHQPAQKLYDAQVLAAKANGLRSLDSSLPKLSLRPSMPVKVDERIVFGGHMLQVRIDCIVLEDSMIVVDTDASSRVPHKALKQFFRHCQTFIDNCNKVTLPKLSVEASLCFAKVALLCRSPKRADLGESKAKEYVNVAKSLLERAAELCNLEFQNAQQLKIAVEESLKLFRTSWYDKITPEELALIKEAMVNGRQGIATHSGHWYQCLNNHPFAIGECGMPMEEARCPECGARIGGSNHNAVEGVTRAIHMEN